MTQKNLGSEITRVILFTLSLLVSLAGFLSGLETTLPSSFSSRPWALFTSAAHTQRHHHQVWRYAWASHPIGLLLLQHSCNIAPTSINIFLEYIFTWPYLDQKQPMCLQTTWTNPFTDLRLQNQAMTWKTANTPNIPPLLKPSYPPLFSPPLQTQCCNYSLVSSQDNVGYKHFKTKICATHCLKFCWGVTWDPRNAETRWLLDCPTRRSE